VIQNSLVLLMIGGCKIVKSILKHYTVRLKQGKCAESAHFHLQEAAAPQAGSPGL